MERRHFREFPVTALTLVSNLEKHLNYFGNDFDGPIGDVVCGGWLNDFHAMLTPEMQKIDTRLAINLLYHLKEEKEFPELANIGDWTQLTSDKTSSNLIARLGLAASRVHFVGDCPGC